MTSVTVPEAKLILEELVAKVESGEEVVLLHPIDGSAIVRLERVVQPAAQPRRLGLLADRGWELPDSFFDPLPEEELRLWEGHGE